MDYIKEAKKCLSELISIESVESGALEGKPFGEGLYKALKYFLDKGREYGFETVNYDNYIGEIVFGEGNTALGVLCHLDVVPKGSGWTKPAFELTEEDGKFFGRGVVDDKGPLAACLLALKRLKDEGFIPKRKIKLIAGCDEESGWKCVEHYAKCAKMPDFGFSPDGNFPVIYAEKGILQPKMYFKRPDGLEEFSGGDRVNMVCGFAKLKTDKKPEFPFNPDLKEKDGAVESVGIQAHGSQPDGGKNAIAPLIEILDKNGYAVKAFKELLFDDVLGLRKLKDETGSLTMSPNMVGLDGEYIWFAVDIRYPATMDGEPIIQKLKECCEKFELLSHKPPLYNDKDGFLIKTLLKVYEEYTGRREEPVSSGGGTYARCLPTGAAFGPIKGDRNDSMHKADEYMPIKDFEDICGIYYRAIKELAKEDYDDCTGKDGKQA